MSELCNLTPDDLDANALSWSTIPLFSPGIMVYGQSISHPRDR